MDAALIKKLKLKAGNKFLVLNAPKNYLIPSQLKNEGITFSEEANKQTYDVIQVFITHKNQIIPQLTALKAYQHGKSIIWASYPKKDSGIDTDLSMNYWDELKEIKLRPVGSAAINKQWTALQIKPEDEVKTSAVSNSNISNSGFGEFINVEERKVNLPTDIITALGNNTEAIDFFEGLSFTNKKEYVLFYLTAKQEKTKEARLLKIVEQLNQKKKNPSEK